MVTYLEILNRARSRYSKSPLSLIQIGDGSSDSSKGIESLNQAIGDFYINSFDLSDDERIVDISSTIGTTQLEEPAEKWDTNVIKAVKYQKNNIFKKLTLLTLSQANEKSIVDFSNNEPEFWYVENQQLHILPLPTAVYSINVHYQKIMPDIDENNILSTVMLPTPAIKAIKDGVFAYLKEAEADPEWEKYRAIYLDQIKKFYDRNKHTEKRQGLMKFKLRHRRGDMKL